jgi:hypothetical protein
VKWGVVNVSFVSAKASQHYAAFVSPEVPNIVP